MTKTRALVLGVFPAATAFTVTWALCAPPELAVQRLVDNKLGVKFLGFWTLGAMAIAFWMPRARARFFVPASHLPSDTYCLPVSIVRICSPFAAGSVLGLFLLAIIQDVRILWLAGSCLVTTVAFWAGARQRLTRLVGEFEMPWTGWNLRG